MIWGNTRATGRLAVFVLALGTTWSLLASAAPVTSLTSIRHSSSKERTRVVIDLSAKADYAHRVLSDPPRIVIDLPQGTGGADVAARTISDGYVKNARAAASGGRIQVILELEKLTDYAVFTLSNPFRVVVDVKHSGTPPVGSSTPAPAPATPKTSPSTESSTTTSKPSTTTTTTKPPATPPVTQQRPPLEIAPPPREAWVIAIDAGHGGQDHGAHYFKTSEKDITLDLAREIKTELERRAATGAQKPAITPIL
ncbi:MAG TPA: AMIN domain-containing protein, partial [Candidatus Eisenbacteria bacterium]|nr:AMIN domain-containing protein [Candidatus Eisenbacteria bacterium]